MASKASAVWTGSLKEGKGTISTATGVLNNANYSFATRFEGATSGTTPEELIAAAHASCFSMALGAQLGGAGLTPEKIETQAAVTLAKVGEGLTRSSVRATNPIIISQNCVKFRRSRRAEPKRGGLRPQGSDRNYPGQNEAARASRPTLLHPWAFPSLSGAKRPGGSGLTRPAW